MPAVDAAKVRELWRKGVDAQRRLLVNYQVNTAFVYGDQWVYAEPQTNALRQVARDPDRVQATVNRLLPSMRTLQAKLHKRPLVWEVAPPDGDDASTRQARLAESVVAATAAEQGWEGTRIEADWVTFLGGTGVLWVDWNPSAGTHLTKDDEGRDVGTGDVVVTVSSIAQVVVEPGAKDAARARWAIRGVALPPEEVKDTYGLKEAPKADAQAGGQIHDLTRRSGGGGADLTMVYHYYRRPSATDEGEMAVVVGEQVVQSGTWPFPWTNRLNLAVQRETAVPDQWCGDTVLSSAIQIQAAYNMAWSSLLEHLKLAGNARLLMPEGNLDLIDEMTDTPGEMLAYRTDAGAPAYLSPPQLPQWGIDSPAMLRRELDDMLGVQDISRGAAPSNIESGLGIQILSEQADSPVLQMAAESARAWSDVASMALQLYAEHATETRTAAVTEKGQPTEGVEWTGDDLDGVTDAKVPLDAVIPKSRAAQQALAVKLWELGIVKDPEVVAEIGDLPDKASFIEAVNPDAAKAADENYVMAMGGEVEVADFDDHGVHRRVHNTFRKSRRYRSLDEGRRSAVDAHMQEHEDKAREEQVQAAAEAMVSPTGMAPPLASEADLAMMPPEPPLDESMMAPPSAGDLPSMEGML